MGVFMGGLGVERGLGFSRGGQDQLRRGELCGEGLARMEERDDGWGPPVGVRRGQRTPLGVARVGHGPVLRLGQKDYPRPFFPFSNFFLFFFSVF
jgi:hypothetical protein